MHKKVRENYLWNCICSLVIIFCTGYILFTIHDVLPMVLCGLSIFSGLMIFGNNLFKLINTFAK